MTISEAAKRVLEGKSGSLSVKEIYEAIVSKGLYEFKAKNPVAVVSNTLRNNSDARDYGKSSLFHYNENGTYSLL